MFEQYVVPSIDKKQSYRMKQSICVYVERITEYLEEIVAWSALAVTVFLYNKKCVACHEMEYSILECENIFWIFKVYLDILAVLYFTTKCNGMKSWN